jgi:hypothetical protein
VHLLAAESLVVRAGEGLIWWWSWSAQTPWENWLMRALAIPGVCLIVVLGLGAYQRQNEFEAEEARERDYEDAGLDGRERARFEQERREEGLSVGFLLFVVLVVAPFLGLCLVLGALVLPFFGAIFIVAALLAPFIWLLEQLPHDRQLDGQDIPSPGRDEMRDPNFLSRP